MIKRKTTRKGKERGNDEKCEGTKKGKRKEDRKRKQRLMA